MILTACVSDNQTFVSKLLKTIQQKALKQSHLLSNTDHLICTDGKFVLQRKLARLSRHGSFSKLVYFHACDMHTLFKDVIRQTILDHYIKEGFSLDVYLLANVTDDLFDPIFNLLSDNPRIHVSLCHTSTSLQNKINAGKLDKKIILNFDSTVSYVECDLFIYFGVHLNPSTMRTMLKLTMNESLGKYMIIDTLSQRIPNHITFVTSSHPTRLSLQNNISYIIVKNCALAGQRLGDMMNQLIFNHPSSTTETVTADQEETDDESEEEEMTHIQNSISNKLIVFIDGDPDSNYLLQYMYQHIGPIKRVHPVHQAWFQPCDSIKLVCFLYTRHIPDFRDITLFCNAFKMRHRDNLIVLILISPVLEKATTDSLQQYKTDFNSLLSLATTPSTTCCSGLHSEDTLMAQYLMPNECTPRLSKNTYEDIKEIIMVILQEIIRFCRHRLTHFNPVFHEQDLIQAVSTHIQSDFSTDIIASFLYRCIPFTAKDGTSHSVIPYFHYPNVFIIKQDQQTYCNVSTITGIHFGNTVGDLLNQLKEEYI